MSMLATTSSDSASCGCKSQPVSVGPALFCIAALIIGGAVGFSPGAPLIVTAQAQSAEPNPMERARTEVESLIARLRGETLPEGIVKSNGRIEATEVDVASKYPGRLGDAQRRMKATRLRLGRSSAPSHHQKPKRNFAGRNRRFSKPNRTLQQPSR